MKRFKFELQAVLEQRERFEKQVQQSYSEALQEHASVRAILTELEMLKVEMLDNLNTLRMEGGIDPHEQVAYQRYLQQVVHDIVAQEHVLTEMERSVEKCRLLLVDASQDTEAVITLRDNALRAHMLEAERVTQNEVDELATLRHQFRAVQAKAA